MKFKKDDYVKLKNECRNLIPLDVNEHLRYKMDNMISKTFKIIDVLGSELNITYQLDSNLTTIDHFKEEYLELSSYEEYLKNKKE